MAGPSEFSNLNDAEWDQLQDRADQFAAARQRGPVDDWRPFLPEKTTPLRGAVLRELIKIDLEFGWQTGNGQTLEYYVARFPELGTLEQAPFDLIHEEFRVRHRYGDRPALATFRARFPGRDRELDRLKALENQSMARSVAPGTGTTGPETLIGPKSPTVGPASPPLPPAPPPSADHPWVSNGYELFQRLGGGHFGEVWKARAPGGVEVTVKVIRQAVDSESAKREKNSLLRVQQLRHPYLLGTHAHWVDSDQLFIAMELADCTLRDRLNQCLARGLGGIAPEELVPYFRQAAGAIDFLHSKQLLHRDVKPDNILLLEGYAKVADFGLTRDRTRQMMTVSFAGTPVYMPPEMWGSKACDQSDLYSLAFAYAELRTGHRPLSGDDFVGIMSGHLERNPDLTGTTPAEESVLRRALAKRPQDRQENCLQFVEQLEEALGLRTYQPSQRPPDGDMSITPSTGNKPRTLGPGDPTFYSAERPPVGPAPEVAAQAEAKPVPQVRDRLPDSVDSTSDTDRIPGSVLVRPEQQNAPEPKPEPWNKPDRKPPPPPWPWKPLVVGAVGIVLLGLIVFILFVILSGRKSGGTDGTSTATSSATPRVTNTGPPTTRAEIVEAVAAFVPERFPKSAQKGEMVEYRGKKYYKRLEYPLKSGMVVASFLWVPPAENPDEPPFYVMENKVWTGFFAEFAADRPEEVKDQSWRGPDRGADALPVMRVSVEDADRFARWLGGKLPTPRQWDRAAGLGAASELVPPERRRDAAVNRATPRSVFGVADLSIYGARDMAGNGREWTREVLLHGGQGRATVPLSRPAPDDLVVLRGRLFTLRDPLTFEQLRYEQRVPQTQYYGAVSPYTGFRVVLELP